MKKIIMTLPWLSVITLMSCGTSKVLTQQQARSLIGDKDKVGIVQYVIAEPNASKKSSIIGQSTYYFDTSMAAVKPPTAAKSKTLPKSKKTSVLVMDTLMKLTEAHYGAFLGTALVPAKTEKKIPMAALDAGMPCLPKQTIKKAIKTTDLDKLITINVSWKTKGGFRLFGIQMGKIKPTAVINTAIYDRSGKKLWSRRQEYLSPFTIKNRGVSFGSLNISSDKGFTGNQFVQLMNQAYTDLFDDNKK